MHVQLSHPARTVEIKGPKKVKELLRELNLVVEAHLVIKGDDLVTEDEMLYDGDQIEIRPVISGGDDDGSIWSDWFMRLLRPNQIHRHDRTNHNKPPT